MDENKQALNELTRSIEYLIDQKLNQCVRIFDGFVLPNGKIRINGKEYSIKQYGNSALEANSCVKVFVPEGNMNLAFFITKSSGEGRSADIPIASSTVLGGIKIGEGLTINELGVCSTVGSTTYATKTELAQVEEELENRIEVLETELDGLTSQLAQI